jgi:hypothetical protein
MSMRRTQHEAMRHARECHVRYITAATTHEPGILKARNRLTDRKLTHLDLFSGAVMAGL